MAKRAAGSQMEHLIEKALSKGAAYCKFMNKYMGRTVQVILPLGIIGSWYGAFSLLLFAYSLTSNNNASWNQ